MREACILSACRTPIGRFRGALASIPVASLGSVAVRAAYQRVGLDPQQIDEVILGNVLTGGAGQAPARQAALQAGLLPSVAALTINKVCGSGLKAVMLAAQAVRCGDANMIVAGGMESMSCAGWILPRDHATYGSLALVDTVQQDGLTCGSCGRAMGDIADGLAKAAEIGRVEQDRFALESHRRAVSAAAAGVFRDEIIPVTVRQGREDRVIEHDEGPRSDTTLEKLAALRPAFQVNGTVTAGNASMISDGAAAVVVASTEAAAQQGLRPMARILAATTVGGKPEDLFTAPVEAIRQVLRQAGRSLADVDLIELNEAFAVQVLACLKPLELTSERVNVDGGAIALGHPIGASGARVLVTLLHALIRRNARCGIAALCLGGGNAVAMLVERE